MKWSLLPDKLAQLMLTAWVGALWSIGYLAVPVLFRAQPDRILAGMLAGEMFQVVGYLGLICGGYLLVHQRSFSQHHTTPRAFWLTVCVLLLGALQLFLLQPYMAELKHLAAPLEVMHSPQAGEFRMLHGVSSILYLLQSLLGAWLLLIWKRSPVA